jgi:Phage tail assembly chaperone protein
MFYVKTASDGSLLQYPYTLADLRIANKGTSWPSVISDEVAAEFGVFPVTPAPQPDVDYTVDLNRTAIKQDGAWLEQWIETPATPEEISERTATKAAEVRAERNNRLADSDWTQLPDAPVDRTAWAIYRQQLRDISKQPGFPWQLTWPVEP